MLSDDYEYSTAQSLKQSYPMKVAVSIPVLYTYFAGQATAQQKQHIDKWAKDTSSQELFFYYLAEWEAQNMQFRANVEKAIKRHQQRICHGNGLNWPAMT